MKKKTGYNLLARSVLFRAWELRYIASALRMKYAYECLEYDSGEEKTIQRLIRKLENNAAKQSEKEALAEISTSQ